MPPRSLARRPRSLRPGLAVIRLVLGETPIFQEVAALYPELVWHQDYETIRSYDGSYLRAVLVGPLTTL